MQLVADAKVLLSAVIGGRAALALRHEDVEQVFTPVAAYDEVLEYLPSLGKKKRLELDTATDDARLDRLAQALVAFLDPSRGAA